MEAKNTTPNSIQQKNETTNFAVIDYQNQQYLVNVGQKITIPLQKEAKVNEKIIFDKVLLTNDRIGDPYLKSIQIEGKVIMPLKKEKKIIIFKYKAKKNYRLKKGHRQKTTVVEITNFVQNASSKAKITTQ